MDVPRRGMTDGGIWPAFVGTLYLVGISLLVSAPIGVLAAVYLNEYAKDNWFNRVVHLAVINLAGVPSIVHALFGLGAFVYAARFGYSILSASLTLAIMTLPVIIASTREALASVPMAFREACWNVGATRWQTIRAVVLPNSISGILTGVILQVSRAAGETAPVMFTGAVFFKSVERGDLFPYGLREQCMALSMHLYTLATQVPNVKESLPYATAVVLLGLGPPRQRRRHRAAGLAARAEEVVSAVTAFIKEIEVQGLRLAYDSKEVLHGITFDVYRNEILAVIGPAQSGKTSMLRCLNRTIDFTASATVSGTVRVAGEDVRRTKDIFALRRKIGMVAPLPIGLPLTIYDNVAFAPRCSGLSRKADLDPIVERCLRQAALWDEVKDRLGSLGTALSGGQQQRLTIARALSHQPEILCLDEFSIAIDPVTTMRIEDVLKELRREITIVLVTNLTQQARRLSDRTMFLWDGEIVEIDRTEVIFSGTPRSERTRDYVSGVFG